MADMEFGPDICQDFAAATAREWLETNGRGSYASATISGTNTRRYHGLLVASLKPPIDRYVLLSRLEETLIIDGARFELSTNQFRNAVHPEGYRRLSKFALDPFPTWIFEIGEVMLERTLFMPYGEDTTCIAYRLMAAPAGVTVQLEVCPFIAFRHFHQLQHEHDCSLNLEQQPGLISVKPYQSLPRLAMHHNAAGFSSAETWYRQFEYLVEMNRGLDAYEDLYRCGSLTYELQAADQIARADQSSARAFLCATLASYMAISSEDIDRMEQTERKRRRGLCESLSSTDPLAQQLALAADQFLVTCADGKRSVIAGYHWFEDWGRDTFISLPGLTITTKRYEIAYEVIRSFAQHFNQGILPNRFPDADAQPEYNTVDATLWYFNAVYQYALATEDYGVIEREIYPHLVDSIDWHLRGTHYNIRVDESDGLLSQGAEGIALTWMDARVGNLVITPRRGKAVEINALWHNALSIMARFAHQFKLPAEAERYAGLAARAHESFNRLFWNEAAGCLYDCIEGNHFDASIRPNQIIAVSLPFQLLPRSKRQSVVRVVEERLLTPFGLRTLAADDPHYRGHYGGDQTSRDGAYHQGTIWPWLLGPFVSAYLKTAENPVEARAKVRGMLASFAEHLRTAGLGSVSEIFEADPPHTPSGCIAQAWSVGELLRIVIDELGS